MLMNADDYLVTDYATFSDVCQQARQNEFVAVDTEFMRQNTYYADLCLVQIGFGDEAYCIDVLEIEDLTPLADLLADESVIKVFHSCRQDFEVLYQRLGVLPKPLFDTQIAAAFCGYDAQAGYARLVMDELEVELDKSQTRTDWSRRPLSEKQICYAAEDVIYLVKLYSIMLERLEDQGKHGWYLDENETLFDQEDYECLPRNAYKRLNGSSLTAKTQHYLVALVLKDKEMYDVANHYPLSNSQFESGEFSNIKSVRRHMKDIIALCKQVDSDTDNTRVWDLVNPLDSEEKALIKQLTKRVSELSEESGVAQSLLATRKDVESVLRGNSANRVYQGWRMELVLPKLEEIL